MELRSYWALLRRRKWIVAITTLVALGAALGGTLLLPARYQATVVMRVATMPDGSIDHLQYNTVYSDRLVNTYKSIVAHEPVLDEVALQLGSAELPKISVTVPANTELLQITVEDADPETAAKAANLLAASLIRYAREQRVKSDTALLAPLQTQLARLDQEVAQARTAYSTLQARSPDNADALTAARRQVESREGAQRSAQEQLERARTAASLRQSDLAVISPARAPAAPAQPRPLLNLLLGLAGGLLGGVALAFLLDRADPVLRTPHRIEEAAGLPALTLVPTIAGHRRSQLFGREGEATEAIRRLRNLLLARSKPPAKVILLTAAVSGDGASTIITNLAAACGQAGRRVALVDANLRAPVLRGLSTAPPAGLVQSLVGVATLDAVTQPTGLPEVWVVGAGPVTERGADLLSTPAMGTVLDQLRERFDLVLIDSPALMTAGDAAALAPWADGVLLVVGCGRAHEGAVRSAVRQLHAVDAPLMGVVINRAGRDALNSVALPPIVADPEAPAARDEAATPTRPVGQLAFERPRGQES